MSDEKEIRKIIQQSVKEAVQCELGAYKVPKEQHYQDHLWISDLRKWQATIGNSVVRSIIGLLVAALGALIFYGFIFLGSSK